LIAELGDLNTKLTGEPTFISNLLAFPLDGSFVGELE